ncbi:UPF0149 family protein [Pseudoalteromonas sp. SaAl2]
MQIPAFTPEHAQQLSTFLASHGQAMTLPQSQGYLFAVICSPEPLDVHQWLEVIVPNTGGQLDETILFAFMGLYHQISEQVYETGFKLPVTLKHHADSDSYLDLDECQMWCQGFIQGAQEYYIKLSQAPALDANLLEALQTAYASLVFFALDAQVMTTIAEQNSITDVQLAQSQYELMGDFALGFAELIEIIAVQSGLYSEEDESWS